MAGRDVHASAQEVLDFWFALPTEQHFAKSDSLDREIAERFGALRDRVLESGAAGWSDSPQTLLAAILLLDQFSRNLHRGQAEAFAGDALALTLALEAIAKGWDLDAPRARRSFFYMPLQHAEDGDLQDLSIDKFEALGDRESLSFAHDHAGVIARFGRFPSRNAALGRTSTPEELDYLSQPGAGW